MVNVICNLGIAYKVVMEVYGWIAYLVEEGHYEQVWGRRLGLKGGVRDWTLGDHQKSWQDFQLDASILGMVSK